MKHKHAEMIHAWADGAEIQVYGGGDIWVDVVEPRWVADAIFRIKPEEPEVIPMASVYLQEGWHKIKDLELMLAANKRQNDHIRKSIG